SIFLSPRYKQFQRGVFDLEDEPRSGRPSDVVNKDMANALEELIKNDRRITYRQIEVLLKIGSQSVHTILHDHIFYRKVCGLWVPQELTDEQKARRVKWCKSMLEKFENGSSNDVYSIVTGDELSLYSYDVPMRGQHQKVWSFEEDIPTTVKLQARTLKNNTIIVFFGKRGIIERVVMDEKKNKSKDTWYAESCLPQVVNSLKNLRPKSGFDFWQFHHNNGPMFLSEKVEQYLKSTGLSLLEHPPNSPDLSPCDCGLFPYINRTLKGHQFEDDEELINAWDQACAEISMDKWNEIFDNWFQRMAKCIEMEGEYIEKI
ncbi:unnamed protein product, partial [Callosobruchus maculatus]